jgi:hypothetical protein
MASRTVRGALKFALVLCVLAAFWNGACKTTEPPSPSEIALSATSVTFEDTAGLANPAPQTVAVTADGQTKLSGLAVTVTYGGANTGWLTATLSDTAAPATLTLTPNVSNLDPADYQATVAIGSATAPNSPQSVTVTFKVIKPVPLIALTPPAVAFVDTQFSAEPGTKTVAITAAGHGALTGLRASVTYGSGPSGWLTATLSDTTAPATLTLKAKLAGLTPASYNATIAISASSAQNTPQSIPITFNVAEAPPINGVTIVLTANLGKCGSELAQETAKVIANANPAYIFMLGTSAYPAVGTVTRLQDYQNCYDPVFGQWKDKTYVTLGDHEVDIDTIPPNYGTGMASGADSAFGAAHVGPPGKNWQSFDIGSWHVVALNVQTPGGYKRPPQIAYHAGSPQLDWLFNDLQSHHNKCTLGVWYESMWISSTHISNPDDRLHKNDYRIQDVRGVWTALYDNNADLVVNGWPRIYERFDNLFYANGYKAPTDSEVSGDPVRGLRQITSGLGGDGPTPFDQPAAVRLPYSMYRAGGNGVLKLVLGDGVYSWEFLNTKYSHIQDSGRGKCH